MWFTPSTGERQTVECETCERVFNDFVNERCPHCAASDSERYHDRSGD